MDRDEDKKINEEAAAEEKPKLPAPVAGRITMQIIPVKVVENAVPTMPKQEKAQAEEIAQRKE